MNMKKRLLSALTLVALVVQLLGCLPAAAATTTEPPEIPKFLIVGNSFASNAMYYFPNVLKKEGVTEYTIGYLYDPGCTLKGHVSNAKTNATAYRYSKATSSTGWVDGEYDTATILDGLKDEDWDYVFLQQGSGSSAEPDTYNEDLDWLMEFVKENVSNPDVKVGWHMTWAYSGKETGDKYAYLRDNFQGNPQLMYQGISNAVQSKVLSRPFSIVIPSGTAIENVRSSYIGDNLQNSDGYHLNALGKLIASYCWYATLTGKTIDSVKYKPSTLTLSDKDKAVIVEAVNSAVANPYSITVPTLDDSTVLYSKTAAQLFSENGKQAIVDHWCPNTRDVGTGRRDIVTADWNNVWGPKESEATVQLLRIITEPYNDSKELITDETTLKSTFAYGLYPDETLSLTLKLEDEDEDESVLPLDTNEYGEIELAFQYVRRDLSGVSIDLVESGFQVFVSTDGGVHWSQNYAGMKSHRIVGEGAFTTGTVKQSKCYEVKSTDLTELVAEGGTINAIQIRPYGDFDYYTEGCTWIRGISITGYETAAPAEEKVMVDVEEDSLRQIVAAHAKRLNSDQWIPTEDIEAVSGSAYDDETGTRVNKTRTYKADRIYYGPVYAKKNAATYERFRADIDENRGYIGATGDEYGDNGINGMDCITVVYDCLSQITTSRSASNWYYTFYDLYDETENPNGKVIPLYQAAERGSIDRNSSNEHFSLVIQEGGQEKMYALYDELKPGDFLLNEDHIRVITSPTNTEEKIVYVGETAGTIEHHYMKSDGSEDTTTLTEDNKDWDSLDDIPNNAVETFLDRAYPGSKYLWGSSMRYDRPIKYMTENGKGIFDHKYLPYTMAEYDAEEVEKENVLITTNSGDFITEGFCAAIDSNYIIRTLTVTLTDKSETESPLWTDTVYGVQSDFSYLFSGERKNASDVTLNAALADLEGKIGQYELKVEVLSGPRIYLADGSVISAVDDASNTVNPTTTFTYNLSSRHEITVDENVENGTVKLNKTSAQYGDTVIVTVVPDPGYELEAIYVDEEPIDGNTFTVSDDHVVTATFVKATYTVTATDAEHGTVTVDPTSGTIGTEVTVTATPTEGYRLGAVQVDGAAIQGNTFTIRGNHTVKASFIPNVIGGGEDETLPVMIVGPQTEPEEGPKVGYVSTRLALEGLIRLEVLATMTGFDEELDLTEAAGMLVWNENPGATPEEALNNTEVESYSVTVVQEYESGKYIMSTNGIPAKEWGDTVYMLAFVTDKDGSMVYADSILASSPRIQAEYLIKKEPEFADVSIALLNYGAAAQTYFGYRTDDLMNASLDADQTVLNWDKSWLVELDGKIDAQFEPSDKVQIRDAQLALEGAIDLNYRVSVDGSVNVAESGLLVWTKDQYSGRDTLTEETASKYELEVESDYYVGRCAQIPAAEIGQTVYACAYVVDENNNKYYSDVLVYSPMAYAEAAIEYYEQTNVTLVNCMKWLVKYGHEASVVFKTGEE